MPRIRSSRRLPRALVILSLGLLALASGCAGLQSMEPPEVSVVSLRPVGGTLMEQRFEVDLRVLNPNNKDINVDGLDFELDINGSRLARGVSSEAFTLPRLGETVTTVEVTTSTIDIIRKTLSLSGTEPLAYRLRGRVHLGGLAGTLKFDESGEVALGNTTRTL